MSDDVDGPPLPQPNDTSAPYWEAARRHELALQRCVECDQLQFPPDIVCVHCQSDGLVWSTLSGQGSLYSYTVVERAFHEGFVDRLPYVVGLIEIDEQAGVRLLTNVIDTGIDQLRVGMPVDVTFEARGDQVLPQFRAREGQP